MEIWGVGGQEKGEEVRIGNIVQVKKRWRSCSVAMTGDSCLIPFAPSGRCWLISAGKKRHKITLTQSKI
jgi:hypothetical protein